MSVPKNWAKDESGAIAPLFALMFVVLAGTVGLAIDYSRAERLKFNLEAAADAANLAAAKAAAEAYSADPLASTSAIKLQAEALGTKFFHENLRDNLDGALSDYALTVTFAGGEWKATSTYKAVSNTMLMTVSGPESVDVSGTSQAAIKPGFPVLDIAMCIDSTGSMTATLDAVKANATTFYDRLRTELDTRGIKPFSQVRVRLAYFKDYGDFTPGIWDPDPLHASGFYTLPDQSSDFLNFASPQVAWGGADWPEGDAVCLNEAMDSPWMRPGDLIPGTSNRVTAVYPLIVVWTDSPAHPVDFANSLANPDYPPPTKMPRSLEDFLDKWNDPAVIDQNNKQILFFGDPTLDPAMAGDRSAWLDIKDWPDFTVGGTLLDANAAMVELLADGIALNVRGLAITN